MTYHHSSCITTIFLLPLNPLISLSLVFNQYIMMCSFTTAAAICLGIEKSSQRRLRMGTYSKYDNALVKSQF